MDRKIIFRLYSLFVLALFISCERPKCTNSNATFENFEPKTKIYKDELAKKLAFDNGTKLSYWFDKYEEKDGLKYLHIIV